MTWERETYRVVVRGRTVIREFDTPNGTSSTTIGHGRPPNSTLQAKGCGQHHLYWARSMEEPRVVFDAKLGEVPPPAEYTYRLTYDQVMNIMHCPGHDYKGHQLGVMLHPNCACCGEPDGRHAQQCLEAPWSDA